MAQRVPWNPVRPSIVRSRATWLCLAAFLEKVLLAAEIGVVVPLVLLPCLAPLSLQGPAHRPLERLLSNQHTHTHKRNIDRVQW